MNFLAVERISPNSDTDGQPFVDKEVSRMNDVNIINTELINLFFLFIDRRLS